MKSHQMKTFPIVSVQKLNDTTATFVFDAPFDAVPGQFVNVWLPGADEKPFSLSDLHRGRLEITVCAVGPFTRRLLECRPGDRLGIRGPFGNGFSVRDHMLLVGGGMGLAPLHFLARRLQRAATPFNMLAGARTAGQIIFRDRFEVLGASFATDDGSAGHAGPVTELLPEALCRIPLAGVCACGPEAMLAAVRDICDSHATNYQLVLERYMKCGIGVCGSCCLDDSGLRVCVEGPVFGRSDLAGVTELGQPHRDAAGCRDAGPLPE